MDKKSIQTYLDPFEKAKLKELANKWGMSQSKALRRLINEAEVAKIKNK